MDSCGLAWTSYYIMIICKPLTHQLAKTPQDSLGLIWVSIKIIIFDDILIVNSSTRMDSSELAWTNH